jgi:putative membrane protein
LFTFIANALMLWVTQYVTALVGLQFSIDTFWTALVGAIIISIVSFVLSMIFGGRRHRKAD